jgi:chromosome segregation ATPase
MSYYAVNHAPRDPQDNHSHHRGSPDSEQPHHSRLHPETHESRSESEEYESASQHSSWSYKSHKNTIDEIKKLLDLTDDDHERVLNEIKRLQDADEDAQEMINNLNSENDSLMHDNHNLKGAVEKLQNMLQNLDMHVRTFMDKYESTNASQRGLSRRRQVNETQSLNARSRDEDRVEEKRFENLLDDVETLANRRIDARDSKLSHVPGLQDEHATHGSRKTAYI